MPLSRTLIRQRLADLRTDLADETDTAIADAKYLDGMVDILLFMMTSATVNVTVTTTGTAAAQVGTGTGTLS